MAKKTYYDGFLNKPDKPINSTPKVTLKEDDSIQVVYGDAILYLTKANAKKLANHILRYIKD